MLKPTAQVIQDLDQAVTAEDAYKVAIDFLGTKHASKANESQANLLVNKVRDVLSRHGAPNSYESFLNAAMSGRNVSYSIQHAAYLALESFEAASDYAVQASPVLVQNTVIELTVKKQFPSDNGFQNNLRNVADSPYPEIDLLRVFGGTVNALQRAIDTTMERQQISDENVPQFMRLLTKAFGKVGASTNDRIEMLSKITDIADSSSELYHKTLDQAVALGTELDGDELPKTAHTRGLSLENI